jgi:hypothetical protein
MKANLEITLEYKLLGEENWRPFPISLGDYFDPDYPPDDGPPDVDDVALHDHAVEYLGIARSLVANTRLTLRDNRTSKKKTIVETFSNAGNNRIIERRDEHDGIEHYWEIIIDSQLQDQPVVCEIMRIGRKNSILILYSHVIIRTEADGSQSELKFYPRESNDTQFTPNSGK